MMRRTLLSLALTLSLTGAATAADCWGNVGGAQANCGAVQMYLDALGRSIPVTDAAGLPVRIISGGTAGGAMTVADGADVTQGAIADAAATAGSTGTISAKLRLMTSQIDAFNTALGLMADAACATDNGSCSTIALLKRGNQRQSSLIALLPTSLGQKTMAASFAVALASDQSAIPVTGTFWQATQPVSGTFWQATQPVSGTFWQATQPVSAASLPLPSGAAADATVGTTNTNIGAPGATACATDTGSCSINAMAQRIAQRLTTINTTLGTPLQAGGTVTANIGTDPTQAPVTPATATATKSVLLGAQATTGAVNPTNGQQGALSSDTNNNLLTSSGGAPNLLTAQVTVTTSDTATVAARALRRSVTITNITGSQQVFCSNTTATTGNGQLIPAVVGASWVVSTTAAIRCIAVSSSQTVSVAETY
jgi:hypothetical protein